MDKGVKILDSLTTENNIITSYWLNTIIVGQLTLSSKLNWTIDVCTFKKYQFKCEEA